MKARLVHNLKLVGKDGTIEERKIWDVPAGVKHPDGVRYRLACILPGQKEPAVLYDNHHPKGHHKHVKGQQSPYAFSGIDQLLRDFRQDVEALK